MWQREQKKSSTDPGLESVCLPVPMSKVEAHSPATAKGLSFALGVPSGGSGVPQSPLVEVARARSRKAARHTGSRQELDIIEPFHWSKIFWWQFWHWPGLFSVAHDSS